MSGPFVGEAYGKATDKAWKKGFAEAIYQVRTYVRTSELTLGQAMMFTSLINEVEHDAHDDYEGDYAVLGLKEGDEITTWYERATVKEINKRGILATSERTGNDFYVQPKDVVTHKPSK